MRKRRTIIAIPVKNEEARIGACLRALVGQRDQFDEVLLLLNNCTDGTLQLCRTTAGRWGQIRILQKTLKDDEASAGEARRLALEYALALNDDGIILTTDADAMPAPNWVAANLAEINQGADVVCGKTVLNPVEALLVPLFVQLDESHEATLLAVLDEIDALIDPDVDDPWPRHACHSGASIAMTAQILRRAGGAPHVRCGEDRALIERLYQVDARIRHAPNIIVEVSARLDGRASGGMADTMTRRMQKRDDLTDNRLEPSVDAYRRSLTKTRLRKIYNECSNGASLADDLLLEQSVFESILRAPYFGAAWAELQSLSPVLKRRRIPFSHLVQEIQQALQLRDQLRTEAFDRSWIIARSGGEAGTRERGYEI